MRALINWRTFFILTIVCAITSMMVIPYQMALLPDPPEVGIQLYGLAFLQGLVIFSIVSFFGLLLARKVGFDLPILEGNNRLVTLKEILVPSILWGTLAGALIVVLELLVFQNLLSTPVSLGEASAPPWAALMASFYGGIAEEVLLRLFVMTLIVWILSRFWKTKEGRPTNGSVWIAIIGASVLFGIGHLPMTSALTEITAVIVLRAIVLNGVGGIIFGWLFWKKGLVSAMIAHFSADIVLHIITPLLVRLFT